MIIWVVLFSVISQVIKIMIIIFVLFVVGNIYIIVVMIQLEIIVLVNIFVGLFFMIFILILIKVLWVFLLNIGIYLNVYVVILVLIRLFNKIMFYKCISRLMLFRVGFCIIGNMVVMVFLVNNCWWVMMIMIKLKVQLRFFSKKLLGMFLSCMWKIFFVRSDVFIESFVVMVDQSKVIVLCFIFFLLFW